jgi:hypothetical protein
MDITVYQSDRHRAPGHLSRQGPPALRWARYEAAQRARFPNSPDRDWYLQAAERLGGNRACLALARKLLKRCYHTLRELGDDALTKASRQRAARVAEPRAARQAPAIPGPSVPQTTSRRQMLWPLDPGFGSAIRQPAPASRPAPQTTPSFAPSRSLARITTLFVTPIRRGQLQATSCRHVRVDGLERLSGRKASPQRDHPIEHLVAGHGTNPRSWTEVRLGARAQTIRPIAHAPPRAADSQSTHRRLTTPPPDK